MQFIIFNNKPITTTSRTTYILLFYLWIPIFYIYRISSANTINRIIMYRHESRKRILLHFSAQLHAFRPNIDLYIKLCAYGEFWSFKVCTIYVWVCVYVCVCSIRVSRGLYYYVYIIHAKVVAGGSSAAYIYYIMRVWRNVCT